MDTIEVRVDLHFSIDIDELDTLKKDFITLQSPFGYRYCDVLEEARGRDRGLILKISYPRYYYGNNAYLITSISECLKVQEHFVKSIQKFVKFIQEDTTVRRLVLGIKLTRVDIPFTYYMEKGVEFNSYLNIYKIFASVYTVRKRNARAKGYLDLLDDKYETVIYSDNGKTDKSSNNRLMIYNQELNLRNKLNEEEFEKISQDYPDLISRMRLEVAKRIRRKTFSLDEFKNFDILSEYFQQYKNYILDNILNKKDIEKIYNEKAEEIAKILADERERRSFTYENFIYRNFHTIGDYEILRRAVKIAIPNDKTRENAITTIRKILREYESLTKIKVMDNYSTITKMREYIESLKIKD